MWVTSSLSTVQVPTVVALGNFDGVHRGHQQVIAPILPGPAADCPPTAVPLTAPPSVWGYSDRCPLLLDACEFSDPLSAVPPMQPGPIPTVVTFYPHPKEFFSGQPRPWLTPLEEKAAVLRSHGVQQLVLLPFNRELAALTPQAFVDHVLIQRLQAQHISVGADFHFGQGRSGTAPLLQTLAQAQGTQVTVVALAQAGGDRISSSRIRTALQQGDLLTTRHLLGRPYTLTGRVVQGQQLGRQLGFPTANLKLAADKYLPRTGVYGVWVYGLPGQPPQTPWAGVMNLGHRPTVAGQTQTLEVHLLHWQGDLYGQTLTVALEIFLRPEQRFPSLDHLKDQIQADCRTAATALGVADRAQVRA
ncbi:MAG: bifunctional riboflavin kinase/FAD synthetase [Cyanobacteria bacterium]|nr:bifunctional riboflavin kinase/FAD synthetase [Cyanobacteriota bacterium]